jgi:glyoxylase-like metal-dependent hydrolase (beta-lactamase superfamily II)
MSAALVLGLLAAGNITRGLPLESEIHVLPVQGNIYMLVGSGSNTTVQIGKDGVLIVDPQTADVSPKIITAVRQLSDQPIRYIINTQFGEDHTGGNANVSKAGERLVPTGGAGGLGQALGRTADAAQIFAHLNVLASMTKQRVPSEYWPTDTFSTPKKELFINGEGIQIIHEPAAHTDGDTIIFFRRSDVISTGDVFIKTGYPVVDIANGGSINGIIKALNEIIDLAIPREKQEGGTMIIPGHGRLCDEADVVEYRDMLTIIRDRVQDMIKKGMTLEQVEAARPTLDYDPLYGSASGPVTTKMFVENVYYSLSRKQ